jgi:hypothetical protein
MRLPDRKTIRRTVPHRQGQRGRKTCQFFLRLTVEERQALEREAGHQLPEAYIRPRLFDGGARQRRSYRKPLVSLDDHDGPALSPRSATSSPCLCCSSRQAAQRVPSVSGVMGRHRWAGDNLRQTPLPGPCPLALSKRYKSLNVRLTESPRIDAGPPHTYAHTYADHPHN